MSKPPVRILLIRSVYALVGVVLIGLGAAILKIGGVGVDPYTALNAGIADMLGWTLGGYQLLSNAVLFIPVLIWGRKYIGPGTVINMVLAGVFIDLFAGLLAPMAPSDHTPLSGAGFFIVGILVFGFGASAYMSAGVGTAPYDAIAPMIVDKTGWAYQRVRVPQDLVILILAILVHGPVGIGTLMTAFFNGPLIQFFSAHVHRPLVKHLTQGHTVEAAHPDAGMPGDPTKLV